MFRAGFARVDVTPPLGSILTGYFAPRISDGVLDPVELNALAIGNEEDSILIITGDFMYGHEAELPPFPQDDRGADKGAGGSYFDSIHSSAHFNNCRVSRGYR